MGSYSLMGTESESRKMKKFWGWVVVTVEQ